MTASPASSGPAAEVSRLLDTSAVLALLEDEPGADAVEEYLRRPDTVVPWPVLLELYTVSLREHGQAEADARLAMLKHLDVRIPWDMDEVTVLTAARLKVGHRISLADAMIAAFAVRLRAVLVHKDPEYESLTGAVVLEPLPYKDPAR
jgi:predicted nucleic acid-binding protein